MKRAWSLTVCTFLASAPVYAADQSTNVALDLFKVLLGLALVLGLMAGSAWLLKRFGLAKTAGGSTIKVVGGVSVGPTALVCLDALALALMGPGAYSIDSYRFGRRVVVLPPP